MIRTADENFWTRSGAADKNKTPAPFIVLSKNAMHVHHYRDEVLNYDDAAPVLFVWQGQHRSDAFAFTVGELRARVN